MSEADTETYAGVLSAFPYAWRQGESRLFRLYTAVGGVLTALLAVFFALALVKAIADSVGGGSVSGYRALVLLLGVAVVTPVMGPVLLVARRHRWAVETGARPPTVGYERLMGLLGFLFLLAGYAALVITVPESFQSTPSGLLGPVVRLLYEAPAVASPLPPAAVALAMLLLDRRFGRRGDDGEPDREAETDPESEPAD